MGVIEDSQEVLQDFLAPELRATAVRLDALEKRFDSHETRLDKQFGEVGSRFEAQEARTESSLKR